jgi:hypothetical protein
MINALFTRALTGILLLMSVSSNADTPSDSNSAAPSTAISTVQKQDKIKSLITQYSNNNYTISFGEVDMGGHCGFVGCEWQKLVSMVITAKRSNSPSVTYLAVVTGQTPDRGAKPTIRFVDLTDIDAAKWAFKL